MTKPVFSPCGLFFKGENHLIGDIRKDEPLYHHESMKGAIKGLCFMTVNRFMRSAIFFSVEEVKSGISALCTLYRYTHPYNGNSVKKIEW